MAEFSHGTEHDIEIRRKLLSQYFASSEEQQSWRKGKGVHGRLIGVPLVSLGLVLLAWIASLPLVNLRAMKDLGLLTVFPYAVYGALFLLTGSFCITVHQQRGLTRILTLHIIVLILILHATPPLLYGTLRYSWAWKHIGVVDYIQRYGEVNPTITYLDAYHNWPGFFALSALIADVGGMKSALPFAPYAQVFFNLLFLGALLIILRTFTWDRRVIWLSAWFFFLSNWVGQDYFAPQALAYFYYLVVIGICLRWFSVSSFPSRTTILRWIKSERAADIIYTLMHSQESAEMDDNITSPLARIGLMLALVMFMYAIVTTHQLTPFMAIMSLTTLVVFQRCRARSLPILMIVFTVAWIAIVAENFFLSNLQSIIKSIGAVLNNVETTLIDLGEVSRGQRLVSLMGRGLTVSVVLLGLLGVFRRMRNGYQDLSAMLLVISPFLILAGNSYGGEMLFRVYLFAVPFLTFFAAALLYPTPKAGRNLGTLILTILLSLGLMVGFLFSYFGKESQYYFTQYEVEAAEYLYENAPENTLLVEGSKSYPSQFRNYERFFYVPISRERAEAQMEILEDPEKVMKRWLGNEEFSAAYLIITRSQKAEVEMVGTMPRGALDHIEQTLLGSPDFVVYYENPDVKIFTLKSRQEVANQ